MKAVQLAGIILLGVGCSDSDPGPVAPGTNSTELEKPREGPVINPVVSAKKATVRAIELAQDGRLDDSIALLEDHVKSEPEDAEAKAVLAQLLQQKAQPASKENRWEIAGPLLLRSAALAREIRSVKGLDLDTEGLYVTAMYNEACAYSRLGEIDKALDSLEKSLQAGFLDQAVSGGPTTRELLVSDPDLDAIRDTDRFRELKARFLKERPPEPGASQEPSSSP